MYVTHSSGNTIAPASAIAGCPAGSATGCPLGTKACAAFLVDRPASLACLVGPTTIFRFDVFSAVLVPIILSTYPFVVCRLLFQVCRKRQRTTCIQATWPSRTSSSSSVNSQSHTPAVQLFLWNFRTPYVPRPRPQQQVLCSHDQRGGTQQVAFRGLGFRVHL